MKFNPNQLDVYAEAARELGAEPDEPIVLAALSGNASEFQYQFSELPFPEAMRLLRLAEQKLQERIVRQAPTRVMQ